MSIITNNNLHGSGLTSTNNTINLSPGKLMGSSISIGNMEIHNVDAKIKGLHKYGKDDLVVCKLEGEYFGKIGKIIKATQVIMDFDLDISTGQVNNPRLVPKYTVDFENQTESPTTVGYVQYTYYINNPSFVESDLELSFSV